jgi:hypothetical protein
LTFLSLNSNPGMFGSFISILCGESCLLASWCIGDRCDMANMDEHRGRSRRPGVEDWVKHRSGTRWPDDREVG